MRALLFSLCLSLLLLLSACGDDKSADGEALDPAVLIGRAQAAISRTSTFHFRLSHENGTTPLPLNLNLVAADGDVALPDRLKADIEARAASINVSVSVIGIGDQTWLTNPFTRRWEHLLGTTIRDFADPSALLSAVVENLKDVQYLGRQEISGDTTHHVRGSFDSAVLAQSMSAAEPGHKVTVDVWLGEHDSLPRRARISGRIAASEADNIVRQIDFSRYNQPVDIRAPR